MGVGFLNFARFGAISTDVGTAVEVAAGRSVRVGTRIGTAGTGVQMGASIGTEVAVGTGDGVQIKRGLGISVGEGVKVGAIQTISVVGVAVG